MSDHPHRATCFCSAVELELRGTPVFQGFCHCQSCRTWLGAPVHAATLWRAEDVTIRAGGDLLRTYTKTDFSHRRHCATCGGHVMNAHPSLGVIDVLAPIIQDFPFTPTMHVHYGEHVLTMRDGLPKFRDMPKELGGSGVQVDE